MTESEGASGDMPLDPAAMAGLEWRASMAVRNKVLLTLTLIAAAATVELGFVSQSPNRLVSGRPVPLWHAASAPESLAFAAIGLAFVAASLIRQTRLLHRIVAVLAALLLLLDLHAAGAAAGGLAASGSPAARTSLGSAFWVIGFSAVLSLVDALQRLAAGPIVRLAVAAVTTGLVFAMAGAGWFDALSIMREYANRRDVFAAELGRHVLLVLGALGPALVIGVPLGILAARRARLRGSLFATLNLLQTIPSIALFGVLIGPLSALSAAVPALAAIGVRGIGFAPAVIALVLYSLLPVVRNTYAGLAGIEPAMIETATGMGFTRRQIFWKVEVPLALPVLLAGLRIVTVQAIGLAVVAALVGAGGLGSFVFQGLGQYAVDLVLLGAVPAILMALAADFLLQILIALLRTRSTR